MLSYSQFAPEAGYALPLQQQQQQQKLAQPTYMQAINANGGEWLCCVTWRARLLCGGVKPEILVVLGHS